MEYTIHLKTMSGAQDEGCNIHYHKLLRLECV